ncbi:YjjG family noncanonical pyrimidine nucleotidase [Winogradskyella maritima]|uniref:YjjG family noncanonical pyrimidine nucleotidase n=1 Tax=Winogradskyella maritima TaxID=1517766 RepID=A0ABV8AL68_9FLAO|nr:YjjG family noncanonical pyrimidine nucleotidase [Winogradskyella maritima]
MTDTIRHVFFDLDHTLWDFEKNSGLTFDFIFKKHNVGIGLPEFLEVYEPINFKYWKLYREERIDKPNLRYGRLKDAFDALHFEVSDNLIHNLSEDYIKHLGDYNHLFDGTEDILKYLQDKYTLHIITNGFEEIQEKKMTTSNIRHYFKTVTNSEMVGVKKPNPKIFNFALDLANAKTHESIMIGDNLEADIQGAANVGMKTILFDYTKKYDNASYDKINKLSALAQYL